MTPEFVIDIGRRALETALLISAPMLLTALLVGLIISIFRPPLKLMNRP